MESLFTGPSRVDLWPTSPANAENFVKAEMEKAQGIREEEIGKAGAPQNRGRVDRGHHSPASTETSARTTASPRARSRIPEIVEELARRSSQIGDKNGRSLIENLSMGSKSVKTSTGGQDHQPGSTEAKEAVRTEPSSGQPAASSGRDTQCLEYTQGSDRGQAFHPVDEGFEDGNALESSGEITPEMIAATAAEQRRREDAKYGPGQWANNAQKLDVVVNQESLGLRKNLSQ